MTTYDKSPISAEKKKMIIGSASQSPSEVPRYLTQDLGLETRKQDLREITSFFCA